MKLKVTDMMCQHCVKTIDKALAAIEHKIDLERKEVEINADDEKTARELISAAGYNVE